jgi:hypothetical protein
LKIATSFYDRDAIVDLNVLFSVSEKKLTGIAFVLSNMVEDREDKEVQKLALQQDGDVIRFIANPSEEIKKLAFAHNRSWD